MAYQGQTATIASELLGRLDAIAEGKADRSSISQVLFSAQRLRNADRMEYLMVLGIAQALDGKYDEADATFDEAFREFGLNQYLVINRFLVLSEQGRRQEGLALLVEGLKNLTDPEVLEKATASLGAAGHLSEAEGAAERLDRMRGSSVSSLFLGHRQALADRGVSELDLQHAAAFLRDRLHEIGYRRVTINFTYDRKAEWGAGLVHQICLAEPAERMFEIESRLNEQMLTANLKAVDEGAFIWYVRSDRNAPHAANLA
ncbi:hypothetical protein [Arenimonas caeni]|uniref:hypothetical protein n=1 Tax=Arenimonas caeni TaxID=2058085 RepID=UPI0013B0690C|nr:hypothetical protein [Arenimonas caeni]